MGMTVRAGPAASLSSGWQGHSVSARFDPLAVEYGAPRSHLLLFATALALHSVAARFAGRAVDRWGPRPALGAAAAGMGIGLLATGTQLAGMRFHRKIDRADLGR